MDRTFPEVNHAFLTWHKNLSTRVQ